MGSGSFRLPGFHNLRPRMLAKCSDPTRSQLNVLMRASQKRSQASSVRKGDTLTSRAGRC